MNEQTCGNCRHCFEQPDWDLGRMAKCEAHDTETPESSEACPDWSSTVFCSRFKCGSITGEEPCIKGDNPEDCEKCERNGQCPNCCRDGDCEFQDYVDARLEQDNQELQEHCAAAQKALRDERSVSKAQREKIAELGKKLGIMVSFAGGIPEHLLTQEALDIYNDAYGFAPEYVRPAPRSGHGK